MWLGSPVWFLRKSEIWATWNKVTAKARAYWRRCLALDQADLDLDREVSAMEANAMPTADAPPPVP